MAADARGYYSALGLNAGAPLDAVRSAFRRLAKECHPDRSTCVDGGQRFRRIAEAYEALSNPSFKTAYDSGVANDSPRDSSPPPRPAEVEPIKCEVCGAVAVQPRRLAFWRVTSFVFASQKTPIQRIFCQACAAKEQWISTIWTGLLGWWGVPWGPIWATGHGITNAVGGAREEAVDERLMWQNAVAFATRGEGELAIALSNILRKSENSEIAQRAAEIIRFFQNRGFDSSAVLENVWKRSAATTLLLLILTFAAPATILALVFMPDANRARSSPAFSSTEDPLAETFGPEAKTSTESAAVTSPTLAVEPTCVSPPSNGQVLVDHRGRGGGHKLTIENGTHGDAIIKMRATTGRTIASFFVARGQTAALTRIPDGSYIVQYASGDQLAKNCRTFVKDDNASANVFPGPETFETRYKETYDGTTVIHSELTYTLYPVPGGTVRPTGINMDEFNKP